MSLSQFVTFGTLDLRIDSNHIHIESPGHHIDLDESISQVKCTKGHDQRWTHSRWWKTNDHLKIPRYGKYFVLRSKVLSFKSTNFIYVIYNRWCAKFSWVPCIREQYLGSIKFKNYLSKPRKSYSFVNRFTSASFFKNNVVHSDQRTKRLEVLLYQSWLSQDAMWKL